MTALDDFRARITEVEGLLDKVAPGWFPTRDQQGLADKELPVGTLSRSAIVLLVSYFEGFLKDLSDETFDRILDAALPCDRLPTSMRGYAVMAHVRTLRSSVDASDVWDAVSALATLAGFLLGSQAVTSDLLPRDETKREVTSIDPQKINMLLRVLDDDDLNRGPMSRYAERLRGLKQIRDNAVHGNEGDLPPLAFGNVIEAIELLRSCADELSSRVDELLSRIVHDAAGPSA